MAEVYLGIDLKYKQQFALKTLQARYLQSPKVKELFENEVYNWIKLEKHPNIVRCHWLDTLDNIPFIFLEWVKGERSKGIDLRSWLKQGPLDLELALSFAVQICRGLIHANQKRPGIVHCDLKPENILIAKGKLAKITDFGLATIVQGGGLEIVETTSSPQKRQGLISSGGVVGTPPYMSPEQWRREGLDVRSDIYAIGCILYEMLTGKRPFKVGCWPFSRRQRSKWLSAWQIQHEQSPLPSLPLTFPQELNRLIASCLAKRQEERFTTIEELLEELLTLYQAQFTTLPYTFFLVPNPFTAIDYNNRGLTYKTLGQIEEALAEYNRAIQLEPNLHQPFYNRAYTYHELQRYEEAVADYTQVIKRSPNDAEAYQNRGIVYKVLQDYDKAIADLNKAIQLNPNLMHAYYNRAMIYAHLQQYKEALGDLNFTIQLDPSYMLAYYNRGVAYKVIGEDQKALANYRQAIQLDKTFAPAYMSYGMIYYIQEKYDQALSKLNKALELDPSFAEAYYNRGLVYNALEWYQEALLDYNRAIELRPNFAQAHGNRGHTYEALGQYEQAVINYKQAVKKFEQSRSVDTNRIVSYLNLAQLLRELQRYDEALPYYKKALEIEPNDVYIHISLGLLHAKREAWLDSLACFEKAAQLGHAQAAQIVKPLRRKLGVEPPSPLELFQKMLKRFVEASSLSDMRETVASFPSIIEPSYMGTMVGLTQEAPPQTKASFEERLAWLRQIANEQKSEEPHAIPTTIQKR